MADGIGEKDVEKKEKWFQAVSSVVIGVIFIIVGIPLWWHTTKVYRATLPYKDIEMLADLQLSYKVQINIIIPNEESLKTHVGSIKTTLSERLGSIKDFSVNPWFEVSVRLENEEERAIVENAIRKRQSLKDLDVMFQEMTSDSHEGYTFVFIPASLLGDKNEVYIGKFLQTFIPYTNDVNSQVNKIVDIIREVYINTNALHNAFSSASKRILQKNDIENIRAQKSVSGYQVSFTLLNADPKSVLPQWDIKQATSKFLSPFLQKFDFLDTSVDSQVIHYSSLQIKPKTKDQIHYLKHQDLPHLINPIEAKLGSHVSLNSNLNFIVYVPSQKHTPLYIKAKNGKVAKSNAFLSPQWGGIVIYNVNKTNDTHILKIDMDTVMQVFISQLKLLLGMKSVEVPQGCFLGEYSSTGVTKWEQLSLLRTKTVEYITTSTITLTSLARLLERISNMVIGDQIQKQVQQALDAIHKSKDYLENGKVKEAFFQAKIALVSSEKAFFDPSILALLYFPDDQKYAIYIPLFLPISLPVIISLFKGAKWLKNGDQHKPTDDKKNN